MARKADKEPLVTFTKPKVTSRHYIAMGPSGWDETFPRAKADAALAAYLGAVPVVDAVENFVALRKVADDGRITTWQTVIGHIGRLLDVHPFKVPPEVAVAFWGQVAQREDDKP